MVTQRPPQADSGSGWVADVWLRGHSEPALSMGLSGDQLSRRLQAEDTARRADPWQADAEGVRAVPLTACPRLLSVFGNEGTASIRAERAEEGPCVQSRTQHQARGGAYYTAMRRA